MNNADLAQIRALLQASAPPERPRTRGPLTALRALLAAPATATAASTPAARRVGLRPVEDDPDLALSEHEAALEARRRAFGQRHEGVSDPASVRLLAAPPPEPAASDDAALAELLRRRSLRFAPAALSPAETPYLPEDLSDPADGAARVYAQAGLFETQMDLPLPEPEPPPSPAPEPEPQPHPAAADDADNTERALLQRLEQVLLSEQAALQAPAPN